MTPRAGTPQAPSGQAPGLACGRWPTPGRRGRACCSLHRACLSPTTFRVPRGAATGPQVPAAWAGVTFRISIAAGLGVVVPSN